MSMQPRNLFQRPRVVNVAFAATLLAAVLGLSHCKAIHDPITGVDARDNTMFNDKRSACEHRCEKQYKQCRRQENGRHERALDACGDLKDRDERRACKEAEKREHKRAVSECKAAQRRCKRECRYREGAGLGGR